MVEIDEANLDLINEDDLDTDNCKCLNLMRCTSSSRTSTRESDIFIAEGVEIVEYGAFKYDKALNKITFPSTLKSINSAAFEQCKDLININSTSIGRSDRSDLEEVASMPSTHGNNEDTGFNNCNNLTEVDLSATKIKTIDEEAFATCNNLGSVKFPRSLESIGYRAFYECEHLNKLHLPGNGKLVSIDQEAFYGCSISTLIIPDSVKSISESAFANCTKLTCVVIPRSTRVHQNAFVGCNKLPSFMLEANLDKMSYSQFDGIVEDISEELFIDEDVIEGRYRNYDKVKSAQFEEGVFQIDSSAFEGCISLESINLPSTLMSIGHFVFRGCSSLKELKLPERIKWVSSELCADCTSLQKAELPKSLKYIYEKAFENCVSLKHIQFPESIKEIHYGAFKNCSSLKSIELPSCLKKLKYSTFENCSSLEKIVFRDNIKIKRIEENTFYNCLALKECALPRSIESIGNHSFFKCAKLKSLEIHQGITAIGDFAFAGCTSIEHIVLPSSTDYLGAGAFCDCKSLQTVTILNPNIEIGREAFAGCAALETVNGLSSSEFDVKNYIEEDIFSGCKSLETPLGNEIHLAAEGKCWPEYYFPQDSHLWIKHKLDQLNKISQSGEHASFLKDYNGNTAFECAVRGGAPDEYLRILASGTNKDGKTHLDLFAERYARSQVGDFTEEELAFLKAQNSKLLAATPVGQGKHYLDSLELLLGSYNFDPRDVPEFIENLNATFETRRFAGLLILDILMPIMRVVAYSIISDSTFLNHREKAGLGWFVLMYITTFSLFCRESLQIRAGGFLVWLTDFWNWIDVFVMCMALYTTVWMHMAHTSEAHEEDFEIVKRHVLVTTFMVWIYAVLKTRVVSIQFAIFVSGLINIIYKLVPFLVVSFLMLGAFAQMYLIDNPTQYLTFQDAFWYTYSEFLAFTGFEEPTVRQKVITGVFGFLIVILLLNVVIAVVSSAWEGVKERGRDDFLLYRIRLFLEVKVLFTMKKIHTSSPCKKLNTKCNLTPDKNYAALWKNSHKFSDVLYRIKSEGIVLFFRIILNAIYIGLSVFFAVTLPRPLCKKIFSIDNSEGISNKCNELQSLLLEAELELQRLEKIDKDIELNPSHEYYHLVNCDNASSHAELKKRIRVVEKKIQKRQKDVKNFVDWESSISTKMN